MGVNYHRVKRRTAENLPQRRRKIGKCPARIGRVKRQLLPRSENRSQLTNQL